MPKPIAEITHRYDTAAPRWRDKMRALGYYDGYLEFLTSGLPVANDVTHVVDIGAGTASFAEAWVAVHGKPARITLLEPSAGMIRQGQKALRARGVEPELAQGVLGNVNLDPVGVALAAHVIEHCADPSQALQDIHRLLRPGGRLFLVVSKPHWCNAIIWLQWRHRTFQRAEILELLDEAGFDCETVYSFPSGPPSRTSRGLVAKKRG